MDLLSKGKSFTIHQRSIQSLAIDLFKVKRNLSNTKMCNIFQKRALTYNLQSQTNFVTDCVSARYYVPNSLSYFTPKFWDMVLSKIKNVNYLQKFKTQTQKRAPENGSCYLCQPCIQNLGFII